MGIDELDLEDFYTEEDDNGGGFTVAHLDIIIERELVNDAQEIQNWEDVPDPNRLLAVVPQVPDVPVLSRPELGQVGEDLEDFPVRNHSYKFND